MVKTIFFDVDGTLVSHKTDSVPESTRKALKLLHENGYKLVLATGRDMSQLKKLPVKDLKFDGYLTMNGQLCLDGDGDREKLKNLVNDLPNCKLSWWNEYAVDIISKDGGKLAGIEKYLELQGQTLADAMAFGDGENDLEMLKAVKIGVAMGNGEKQVKHIADYVTTDIDADGIFNACKHYKLI